MTKYWSGVNMFEIKEGDRSRIVVIPDTGDRQENEYLEEVEREKTAEQLRKLPPRATRKVSKADVGGALSEYRNFLKRRRENANPKYY
ncbi:hypothetical protein LCGC14_0773050 [marine sediment metagenome]|uniref:Uncharacterized protein n=1 Tax=marine sediment metagenome TaxID=412755 RepID=A0A0F9QHJ7_9ZZZZ